MESETDWLKVRRKESC